MSILRSRLAGFVPVQAAVLTGLIVTGLMAWSEGQAAPAAPAPAKASPDSATVAVIAGYFPTFGEALRAAGLRDLLQGEGPFTVFAPGEGAFALLPAGTLKDLLKPENKAALQAVLRYHIVPGKILAADLKGRTSLTTLDGATLQIRADADGITVNGARILTPDMEGSNGVIHVVSAVYLPPK